MLRSSNVARARRGHTPARARIVIFAAGPDWHTAKLAAAFSRQNVETAVMRLEQCAFDTDAPSGLRLGGSSDLPDGVLVKNVSGGSFEAVTRRLGVLHALRILEIPVDHRCRTGGESKVSGTLRGTFVAGTRIIATLFRVAAERS